MPKIRVDLLLVERHLAESRSQAQRLVLAGQVRANGQLVTKPSFQLTPDVDLHVDHGPRFVSRGGEKLEAALERFQVQVNGRVCADIGASTGGFTDCLLQHGASRIYAIDVGQGILHWRLRRDRRVLVMERTNARFLAKLDEPVELITIDVAFISLKQFFHVIRHWYPPAGGDLVVLIKPQFEAGRQEVSRGRGVIRDRTTHQQVLLSVLAQAEGDGYAVHDLMPSPILGPKGNVEFLSWLTYPGQARTDLLELVLKNTAEVESSQAT